MKPELNKYYFIIFSLVLAIPVILISCNRNSGPTVKEPIIKEDFQEKIFGAAQKEKKPEIAIKYQVDSLKDKAAIDSFHSRFNEGQKKIIFSLNRIDETYLKSGNSLIIPDSLVPNIKEYSPFPEKLGLLAPIAKAVIISQRIQAFSLYEHGELIRWGPVSSGKRSTPTHNGLFYGNFKAKRKISTVNPSWILPYYFNFENFEGVGVHQYALPGYPASHACVRLKAEDASVIYDWAEQWTLDETGREVIRNGTAFMVFGEYDYENPSPWLELAKNPDANKLRVEEIRILEGYVFQYLEDPRNCELDI